MTTVSSYVDQAAMLLSCARQTLEIAQYSERVRTLIRFSFSTAAEAKKLIEQEQNLTAKKEPEIQG